MNYFENGKIFFVFICFFILNGCSCLSKINPTIISPPQNIEYFLDKSAIDKRVFSKNEQKKALKIYLQKFFSPWDKNEVPDIYKGSNGIKESIIIAEKNTLNKFYNISTWGANFHPHSYKWLDKIKHNMNLKSYKKVSYKAIIILNTDLRRLPTSDPAYYYFQTAGEGYPFDHLQASGVYAGTPIVILHYSKDKAWALVKTRYTFGWVKNNKIALVSASFIHQWKKANFYAAPTRDYVPLINQKGRYYFSARIGSAYPIKEINKNYIKILIPAVKQDGYAESEAIILNKSLVAVMPLSASIKHFVLLIQEMIGQTYGWGGYNGYRDCSSSLRDLFAPFGIWLPRNSKDQQLFTGKVWDIESLPALQKEQFILTHAIPFRTLLGLDGHILLYLGSFNGHPMVFQTMWGLHTNSLFVGEGRAVIGQSVISNLDDQKYLLNVQHNQLDLIKNITIIN